MSNKEYFSDFWENKSAPEFKEFKAELYEKKNEYFSNADEIKSFNSESFDHTPNITKDEEKEKKKRENIKTEKQKVRTRLQKILDNVSKTATKVATTVVGVAAVGVGAVIALSPLFSPDTSKPTPSPLPEAFPDPKPISVSLLDLDVGGNYMSYELALSGLQVDTDYDILISNEKHSFLYGEVSEGISKELVLGLNASESYTLSVIEKTNVDSFVHYEQEFITNGDEIIKDEFQGVLEIPKTNNITVEWHEDKNTINLPALYTPSTDANYKYRVSLTDQNGEVVASYLGDEGSIALDVPLDAHNVSVTYETLYDTGKHEVVYSTENLSEVLRLEAPKIFLSDEKTLVNTGLYAIEYEITSSLDDYEIYDNFTVTINGIDHSPYFSPSIINERDALFLEFTEPVDEFELEATLTMKGAYGGNPRTVVASKHYTNELEFYDEVYYSSAYNTIEFKLLHSEIGGYVLIKDLLLGTEEQITLTNHSYSFTGDNQYSYALYDKNGNILTEEKVISFAPFSTPEYTFNYCNPGEVIYTVNEDGTLNFYFDTKFSSDDPNAYYEISLSSSIKNYVFRSTDAFLKAENLPYDEYGVNFRAFSTDTNGTVYEFYNTTPSGTTYISPESYISYSFVDEKTVKFEFDTELAFDGEIHLTINDKEYLFTEDDFVLNGFYNTITAITDSERIESFELTVYTYYRTINNHLYAQYADEIKGTPYLKTTITF